MTIRLGCLSREYFSLIGKPQNIWLDAYLNLVLFSSILGFLSLKSCTNTCLVLLLLPALFYSKSSFQQVVASGAIRPLWPILLTLCMPVLAILISQALRQDWLGKAFDGPARFFLATPLLFYFIKKRIDFVKLLGLAAPLALILLVFRVHQHPEVLVPWGGRFATAFVDPTAFGTYTLVLTAMCLFSISTITKTDKALLWLQIPGLLAGLYLLAGSGTRGSWFAIPVLLVAWLILKRKLLNWCLVYALLGLGVLGVSLLVIWQPALIERFFSSFSEVSAWWGSEGRLSETSAGIRLTMWKMSWALFLHSPVYGYGDMGFQSNLNQPWLLSISNDISRQTIFFNGPHNEFLANLLRSGVFGGASVLCLFFLPLRFFWRNRLHPRAYAACHLGMAYLICLIISSFSCEVLTLKFTTTFYGLIMAGLVAQVIWTQAVDSQ